MTFLQYFKNMKQGGCFAPPPSDFGFDASQPNLSLKKTLTKCNIALLLRGTRSLRDRLVPSLNATLHKHLNNHESDVAKNVKNNLYVDNFISGCDSEEKILQYYN